MVYLFYFFGGILLIAFFYLCFTSAYFFLIAIAGFFRKPEYESLEGEPKRIAVLIPCYNENSIIINTVKNLLTHDYAVGKFTVFVIADSIRPDVVRKLRTLGSEVIEVSFAVRTKARALHAALNYIPSAQFDVAFILDADNHLAPGCLKKVSCAFTAGLRAVQCHRVAKNENTTLALLDAINEEINNTLLRKGQSALGFSATASGSGMAFDFKILKEIFNNSPILESTGEDKEIDIQLMKRSIKMHYLENALVLDEKVSSFNAFRKQRLRWTEAYLNYVFRLFYKDSRIAIVKTEFWNRFIQLIVLPRSLYIMTLSIVGLTFFTIHYFDIHNYRFMTWLWLGVTSVYFTSLLLCLPKAYVNWRTVKSLVLLPAVLMVMAVTVTKVKTGRKEFIHTPKSFTQSE